MATIKSIDRPQFVKAVINQFTTNKVGQFSKYLDTEPTFVTYYTVNLVESRADIGSDNIQHILGNSSPIRYNRIDNFPVYIKSGLEPDTVFEDGNVVNELEISDITILPGTITPKPLDHMIISLPNMTTLLVRLNGFRNMTIQSNDFFTASGHVVQYGSEVANLIEPQVVERYKCIFENIGTQNSCFIRSEDYDKAVSLNADIQEISSLYNALYYNKETNSFIFNESFYSLENLLDPSIDVRQREYRLYDYMLPYVPPETRAGMFPALFADPHKLKYFRCFMKPNTNIGTETIYDIYMTKFIKESGLFANTANYDTTSAITYEDVLPLMVDSTFKHTLWYAVMTKDATLLSDDFSYVLAPIQKPYSAIGLSRFPKPTSVRLTKTQLCPCKNNEYFPQELLSDIRDGKLSKANCECTCEVERDYINMKDVINNPNKDYNKPSPSMKEYKVRRPEEELTDDEKCLAYLNTIIYNHIYGLKQDIDTKQLLTWLATPSFVLFEYFPIILFILKERYTSYFSTV